MRDDPSNPQALLSQVTRSENLKRSLKWALAIHVGVLVIAAIGLPGWEKKEPFDMSKPVIVDLVAPTGAISKAPNKTPFKGDFNPNAKPKQDPKKIPAKAQEAKPPSPVKSDAAKKEDTPKPKPTPPKPAEKKLNEPKKLGMEKAPDETPPKKEPEKKAESQDNNTGTQAKQEEFNSVLKNLLGDVETPTPEVGNPYPDVPYDPNTQGGVAPVTSETLALSEMDALKTHWSKCWNVPVGAVDAADLNIQVRIEVGPDMIVRTAEVVDTARYNTDSFFRAAADSARRAVLNPTCNPIPVPPEKYDVWKNITINFNPRDMF